MSQLLPLPTPYPTFGPCSKRNPSLALMRHVTPFLAEIILPAAMRASQFHCVVNTVLALLGSALAAFGVSSLLENKFNMVHIQVLSRGVLRVLGTESSVTQPCMRS